MPRHKSDNRLLAFEKYEQSGGSISCKEIAATLGVSDSQIRNWKAKDKWDKQIQLRNQTNTVAQSNKPQPWKEGKPWGAPKGSENALGNKGGHGGPNGNDHAVKHGFFSRIFPDDEETRAILDDIQVKSSIEILWEQIVIQYTAIARAQKIMFVKDQEDITEHLKKRKVMSDVKNTGDRSEKDYQAIETYHEEEWELQFAWDKQATFLTAQSRAIKTLEGLIARYEQMLHKDLDVEEQQLRVDKLRAEIAKIKDPEGDPVEDDGFIEALQAEAIKDIWNGDGDEC
jgi:uncharacterized protein YjcR